MSDIEVELLLHLFPLRKHLPGRHKPPHNQNKYHVVHPIGTLITDDIPVNSR